MSATRVSNQSRERLLWGLSLALSLVLNGVIFFSFVAVSVWKTVVNRPLVQQEEAETIAIIVPMTTEPSAGPVVVPPPPETKPDRPAGFARTTDEQASERPENAAFIGERDTRATSDRAPDPTAPALPSQAGVKSRYEELETTQSDFKDGVLGASGKPDPVKALVNPAPASASPGEAEPTPAIPSAIPDEAPSSAPPPQPEQTPTEKMPGQESAAPKETKLLQGPDPVDVPVLRETPTEAPKPKPDARAQDEKPVPTPETLYKAADEAIKPSRPRPKPNPRSSDPTLPGASTYQRKNQIRGSISRMGVSAMDVVNTPLGRYQASISRAVSLEWQRNNVRNRDFVTPGYLTVRFLLNSNGKVTKFDFVDHAGVGEVQRGFTRKAVFDAAIPSMPEEVKKDIGDEPLEITFNFYYQ